jgi:hypothetical protein
VDLKTTSDGETKSRQSDGTPLDHTFFFGLTISLEENLRVRFFCFTVKQGYFSSSEGPQNQLFRRMQGLNLRLKQNFT